MPYSPKPKPKRCRVLAFALVSVTFAVPSARAVEGWRAGAAKVDVTPEGPIWMAGYAARDHESEGALHPLWARALVLEAASGRRAVLVTLDLCGIDRALSNTIRDRLHDECDLDRPQVVLACSHTHSGPVVGSNLITMYPLDEGSRARVASYTERLIVEVVDVVKAAISDLGPAEIASGLGRCDFAVNRRENDQSRADELRRAIDLKGPVDHDVPVLRLSRPDGEILAIAFGYACHCTTLDGYELNGDYAGFAQAAVEEANPGAIALFWAGCGADQNPLPRRSVELASDYGAQLAEAVRRTLTGPLRDLAPNLECSYDEVPLDFAPIPPESRWRELSESQDRFESARADALLRRIEADGPLPTDYPYPIQAWRLGDDLLWIFLGGEVVVDYSARIKRNLGSQTWVAAYANDVMAYIPSLRVLNEGGYEGGGAMLYYGQPAPWSVRVEDQVIAGVRAVLGELEGHEDGR